MFKTEVIWRRGLWKSVDVVEFATLVWVDRFNNRRLLEPIGVVPPAELEQAYYFDVTSLTPWRRDSHTEISGEAGAVQLYT